MSQHMKYPDSDDRPGEKNQPVYYQDTSGCRQAEELLGYRPSCLEYPLEECLEKCDKP
jgi:hypothetical protein